VIEPKLIYDLSIERKLKEMRDCMDKVEKGLKKMRECIERAQCIINAYEKKSEGEENSGVVLNMTSKKRQISLVDLLCPIKRTTKK